MSTTPRNTERNRFAAQPGGGDVDAQRTVAALTESMVVVDINPEDAERLGIEDEDYVRLVSRRGEIEVKAQVTENVKPGVLWSTPHFAEASINKLTNDVLDPVAKIPEYKASAARVEVIDQQPQPSDD